MATLAQDWSIEARDDENWVPVSFYTRAKACNGFIYCPNALRLLDVLNTAASPPSESNGTFLRFIDAPDKKNSPESYASYINKTTVELVALKNGDLARGCGSQGRMRPYPYIEKTPVPVLLEMRNFILTGNIYCLTGQDLADVLNQDAMFLPLTDVIITSLRDGANLSCPFVAVRRDDVISSRVRVN